MRALSLKIGYDPYAITAAVPRPQPPAPAPASVPAGSQYQSPSSSQPNVTSGSLSNMFQAAQNQRAEMMQKAQGVSASTVSSPQPGAQNVSQVVAGPVERVDPTKLWEAWQRYMVKIKEINGQLYGSMGTGPQIAADGITVEVRIASQYEVDNIEKNTDLVSYLREATANNHLVLKAVIDPMIAKEREIVYTASQKFEKMKEKNPYLERFISELGLSLG